MTSTETVNITTPPTPHSPLLNDISPTTNIICGTVVLLIAVSGLIVYMLFIIIALGRKKFQRNSYFTMAGWLGVADCICLVLMITYAAPCIILQKDLSDLKFIGGLLNIGWFSGLPLIVFLAANRFFCICHTDFYKSLFNSRKTKYYCISALVFGTAYSVPSFLEFSPLFFKHGMMSWQWKTDHVVAKYISIGEITIVMVVTLATHCLNILVFKEIHAVNRQSSLSGLTQRRNAFRERKMFMQFFITTLWLPIFDIPFISLSYLHNPSPWLGYFVTITYTLNCSINGWVYIIMNTTVRRGIKEMFPAVLTLYAFEHSSTEDGHDEGGASFNRMESKSDGKLTFYIRPEVANEVSEVSGQSGHSLDGTTNSATDSSSNLKP